MVPNFTLPKIMPRRAVTNDFLKPGVYEAHPYTCLVLVPSARFDEKFVVGIGKGGDKMPMVKPALKLIPRTKK